MKKISDKRKKTDADFEALAKLEWYGSLYVKDGKTIIIPSTVLESTLTTASRKFNLGKDAMRALTINEDPSLEYEEPHDIDERWKDETCRLTVPVRIKQNRIQRTRPVFKEWSATFTVQFDAEVFNKRRVLEIIEQAGQMGLCDWRPKFGRFTVQEVQVGYG